MIALLVFVAAMSSPSSKAALVHHPVSTKVASAQERFDEGLTMIYAFNRKEAQKRFAEAASLDPTLAMAWWGVALGAGPNINESMDKADLAVAQDALAKAQALETNASPEEQRYIAALALRYPATIDGSTAKPYAAYRDAMKQLSADFPDDDDAAVLYAESIMDLGGTAYVKDKPSPDDQTVVSVLSTVLGRDPGHVGADHYLIHAWDHAGYGSRALASANYLAALTYEPAASHLAHMPGHTYLDVGDFDSLENTARTSVTLDDAYAKSLGVQPFSLYYHRHNLDFWAGAALLLDDVGEVDQATAEFVAGHSTGAMMIYARERDFAHVDTYPAPDPGKPYAVFEYHYARMLSALSRSDTTAAARELAGVDEVIRTQFKSAPTDVPEGALAHGRMAHALGDDATAVTLLRHALDLSKNDPPEEFAPWFYPAGEWLGDILFEKGDFEGAEAAFRADLKRTPNNARVLYGLSRALEREGRRDEARALAPQIAANWRGDSTDLHTPNI